MFRSHARGIHTSAYWIPAPVSGHGAGSVSGYGVTFFRGSDEVRQNSFCTCLYERRGVYAAYGQSKGPSVDWGPSTGSGQASTPLRVAQTERGSGQGFAQGALEGRPNSEWVAPVEAGEAAEVLGLDVVVELIELQRIDAGDETAVYWNNYVFGRGGLTQRRRQAAAQSVVDHLLEWSVQQPCPLSQGVGDVVVDCQSSSHAGIIKTNCFDVKVRLGGGGCPRLVGDSTAYPRRTRRGTKGGAATRIDSRPRFHEGRLCARMTGGHRLPNWDRLVVEADTTPVFRLTTSGLGYRILWLFKWPGEYIVCADMPWKGSES